MLAHSKHVSIDTEGQIGFHFCCNGTLVFVCRMEDCERTKKFYLVKLCERNAGSISCMDQGYR